MDAGCHKDLLVVVTASVGFLIASDHEVVLAVRNILPSVAHVDARDAIVLGAPIGGDIIIDTMLLCKFKEFWRLAERLKNLITHDAFYVLKNCFSLSTLVYTGYTRLDCST